MQGGRNLLLRSMRRTAAVTRRAASRSFCGRQELPPKELHIFDSMVNEAVPLRSSVPGHLTWSRIMGCAQQFTHHLTSRYMCGPTVYDAAHLGHARYGIEAPQSSPHIYLTDFPIERTSALTSWLECSQTSSASISPWR